ncbi:MAG: asparagine synthetase B family protein [Bacteroidales bacterium]|nr:asparagine synthetase B family protein [Bacteroidales bacterium]
MTTLNGIFKTGIINTGPDWSVYSDGKLTVFFHGSVFLSGVADNPCQNPPAYIASQYLKSGLDCFRHLDGTFLVMLKDGNSLYFHRDRFGSGQQLYYNQTGFSTNMNNLSEITNSEQVADWENLTGFLQFGYIPAPGTGLKGVNKLPSGYLLTWDGNALSSSDLFFSSDFHNVGSSSGLKMEEAIEQYHTLHLNAIRKRIAGADNVGVLLSGGYDSAGNIAALREIYNGKVQAFSVGFKDNPWSEIPLARQMAERSGAEFHQYEIDGSELGEIPELIRQLGDPFQEGGMMVNFAAMRLASGFKPDVILGGDGNDQHHGTFARELALNHFIRKSGINFLQKGFYNFTNSLTEAKDDNLFRYGFHNRKILNILTMDAFGFSKGELKALGLNKPDINRYGAPAGIKPSGDFDEFFFQRQYLVDVKQVINEIILFKAGQNAALRGMNIAFPYMDMELAKFIAGLPRELRFQGSYADLLKGKGKSKVLHKNLYSSSMPDALSMKKKQGGFAPLPLFFQSADNLNLTEKIILQSGLADSGINMSWIAQFIKRYRQENQKASNWFWYSQVQAFKLFNLLVLAVWWESTFNGKSVNKLEELIK